MGKLTDKYFSKSKPEQDFKVGKVKILKIALLSTFILSLMANGVLGYFIVKKNKFIKSLQTCPTLVESPALIPASETPAPTTSTPSTKKKSTPTTDSSSNSEPVQEEVPLPPPPPAD